MYSEQAIDDRGSGTPLVLLHSSLSNRTQWRRLGEQLQSEYRILAIDLYGYGAGEFPDDPAQFSLAQEAGRIAQLIGQRIGEAPFHLIGHSYGGATALRLAHTQPDRILSLGLYEPVAFHLLDADEQAYQIIRQIYSRLGELLAADAIAEATALFIDFWSGPGSYQQLPPERQRLLNHHFPKVQLDFNAILEESLRAAQYRNLTLPVCLLRSPESPLPSRRVAEVLEQHLPRVETHWCQGGHMAPVSHAATVNPHWIDFLRRQRD